MVSEWLKQAAYDFETAEAMFRSGRNVYSVFMCHLAVEKALKAACQRKTGQLPPKTHSLVLLLGKTGEVPEKTLGLFIAQLNDAGVATRYPEALERLIASYPSERTDEILKNTRRVIEWIKTLS